MKLPMSTRWQLRLVNLTFVALFIVAVILLQWVGQRYHWRADWTRNSANSLSAASVAVVKRLNAGPVEVTAFAGIASDQRFQIEKFIGRYQRFKPDIEIKFVDPDAE